MAYSISQAKKELKAGIQAQLLRNSDGNYFLREDQRLPFYLVGAPGIGKTQLVHQVAKELKIGFVSSSITHHTRNTFMGLPVIKEIEIDERKEKFTEYTMSEIIAEVEEQVEAGYTEGILLLDEFASMADSLVAPMLAFLQTKNIGRHHLPEGWTLVLCANPPKYNKTARNFDMAILDRVRTMEIQPNVMDFIKYGKENGVHPIILNFLKENMQKGYVCKNNEDGSKTVITTRGWENLSNCLKGYEILGNPVSEDLIKQYIKSDEIAYQFLKYYMMLRTTLPEEEIQDILKGNKIRSLCNRYRKETYFERWNMVNYFSNYLTEICRSVDKKDLLIEWMTFVCNDLKKALSKLEDQGYEESRYEDCNEEVGVSFKGFIENYLLDLSDNRLVMDNTPFGDEDDSLQYGYWDERVKTAEERQAWNEILQRVGDFDGNIAVICQLENWITKNQQILRKEINEKGVLVDNVLTFIRGIELVEEEGLVESFISFLQKKEVSDIVVMNMQSKKHKDIIDNYYTNNISYALRRKRKAYKGEMEKIGA